jgi:hypothetical protein
MGWRGWRGKSTPDYWADLLAMKKMRCFEFTALHFLSKQVYYITLGWRGLRGVCKRFVSYEENEVPWMYSQHFILFVAYEWAQ